MKCILQVTIVTYLCISIITSIFGVMNQFYIYNERWNGCNLENRIRLHYIFPAYLIGCNIGEFLNTRVK